MMLNRLYQMIDVLISHDIVLKVIHTWILFCRETQQAAGDTGVLRPGASEIQWTFPRILQQM